MPALPKSPVNILYVFGGEKAQGAEIVIERLMYNNTARVNAHLLLAPGKFATILLSANKPYHVQTLDYLKKLNRSSTSKLKYYLKAARNYFAVSYEAHKYIKKNKIAIVHANTMVPASYLIPLIIYSRLFNSSLKWVWSDHDLKYFTKLDTTFSKLCVNLYDYTLVVSNVVKRKYPENKRVLVLYNGLDIDDFKSDQQLRMPFRNKLQLEEDNIVIGMAAVVSPDKGQLALIKAFNNLLPTYPNIRLLLAGGFANDTPEYSQEVRDTIAQSEYITFLGFIDNMTQFFNGCDIIVNNSNNTRSEPLGTTIYEAMACEKVVLGSNTGGTPEIITANTDGFIFDTESVEDLQRKLDAVLFNYAELGPLRKAAREKVINKFNIKTMVSRYNDIIYSLGQAS